MGSFIEGADCVACIDPALRAQVVRRAPLEYAGPVEAHEDRPDLVRAASGICFLRDELVVVQDDASFIATFKPSGKAQSHALPAGPAGRRRFEKRLGNKYDKLDLESAFAFDERVFAIGSGSLPVRERVVVFDPRASPAVKVVDASALFAQFHANDRFSGGALNIEGAAAVGDVVRFFQRGNGVGERLSPATVDVDLAAFVAWVDGAAEVPAIRHVRRFDLGTLGGVRLGFTDACATGDGIVFLASAEGSRNTVDDGELFGSCIGSLRGDVARLTPLLDEAGVAAPLKAEGIAIGPHDPRRAWVVLDSDDPDIATDLCEVTLDGPW